MRISNKKILAQLGRNIFIWPLPLLEDFDAAGFNLRLGPKLLVWPMDLPYTIDHRKEHVRDVWANMAFQST